MFFKKFCWSKTKNRGVFEKIHDFVVTFVEEQRLLSVDVLKNQ